MLNGFIMLLPSQTTEKHQTQHCKLRNIGTPGVSFQLHKPLQHAQPPRDLSEIIHDFFQALKAMLSTVAEI
jgi:hypothetical protein